MTLDDPFFDAEYIRNGYRYGYSYYKRRIGNHTQAFKWYHSIYIRGASSHMNSLGRFCPWIPYTLKTEEPPALSGKQPRIGDYRWTSRTEHAATPEREMSAVFLYNFLYRPTLCGTPSGAFVFCSCLHYSTLKRSCLSNLSYERSRGSAPVGVRGLHLSAFVNKCSRMHLIFVLYIYRTKLIVRVEFELGTPEVQRLNDCSGDHYGNASLKIRVCVLLYYSLRVWIIIIHLLYKIQMTKRNIKDLMIFIEAFCD